MDYIDIHSHLNFDVFDGDRDDVLQHMKNSRIHTITVGTDYEHSKQAVSLAEKHDGLYATIGLHPTHADKNENGDASGDVFDMNRYRELGQNKKVVAIGECGLDYFRMKEDTGVFQDELFVRQIELANELQKPLMLHIRNGANTNAYTKAYEILKTHAKVLGDLHFFVGTVEDAKMYLDLGFSFSFTAVITFARDYDEVIKYIPADRIMSETDSPFVAPATKRGKRNDPTNIIEVVESLAKIRGVRIDEMRQATVNNAEKFFSLG